MSAHRSSAGVAARARMTILSVSASNSVVAASERWRVHSFARLPDWSGRWRADAVAPVAAGGIVESLEHVRRRLRAHPPYKPEWEARFRALLERLADDPPGREHACTQGIPMLTLQSPLTFEALITPEETALVLSGREIRHIYTDGRRHLPADHPCPTHWGDSIGFWDGHTLVIDTIALDTPRIFIWRSGAGELVAVLSERLHFVERLRMVSPDLLEDEMTIHDPESLAAPWTLTHQYRRITSPEAVIHEDGEGSEPTPVVDGHVRAEVRRKGPSSLGGPGLWT